MTISFPRKKTRQQAQDYRRFQQGAFGGGQNSDTPATKIGQADLALLKNAVSYDTYFEGHYGIQINSDERAPGTGDIRSLEQHPVTGRWLLHRGNDLWLSSARAQAEWSLLAALGPDGSLEATGSFIDGSVTLSGDITTYLSNMVLTGVVGGQELVIAITDGVGPSLTVVISNTGGDQLASGTALVSAQPATITLSEDGGSGVSGSVDVDGYSTPVAVGSGVVNEYVVNFSLRGLTLENTDNWELWWKLVVSSGGNAATLTLYKDAAMTEAVAKSDFSPAISFAKGYIVPLIGSGISGQLEFQGTYSIVDGVYAGTPLTFLPTSISIDGASTITSYGESGFIVFDRGAAPANIYVDQALENYWFLSTRYGYGNTVPADSGSGPYDYRYLYTYSRIVDSAGSPAYGSNRISGRLQFEGPSLVPVDFGTTDYWTVLNATGASSGSPNALNLRNPIGVPVSLNAASYITHISIYRTLDVGVNSPTTNPEQYIWIADVPIYATSYTDTTDDAVLLARLEAGSTAPTPYIYALPSRGWREMDRGIGAIRTDFMFTAFPDTATSSYCDVQVIPRLIGYFNPLQRILLQDPVSHLTTTRELMVVVCPSSAYALTTGINQDVGGGLYYIPIITNFERVSGNVGVASRYKLFKVDESSFLAFCTDHTIRVFSAMSWGAPLDGNNVHKIAERALGDAKVAFVRGVVFFWFMDGTRPRCLRYGTGQNTGNGWAELERAGWVYPAVAATQETDESLLRLTILGESDGVFYAIENEAPDRIYDDESPVDAPALRGAGALQLSDLNIVDWNGVELFGRLLDGYFKLYGSQVDADADANVMGQSDLLLAPTDDAPFYGVVNGTVDVLDIANCSFTVINGVAVGSLLPIPSPFRFRDLTATVEAFICFHMVSHVYMRFPYGKAAPLVKARWYADGLLADSSNQVPDDGEIQSFRLVKGKRIQLELEPQSSGWQVTAVDTEYQTQDVRLVRGPWNSNEAAVQKEIASDMISWVNSVSSVINRADTRQPKQNYQGVTPVRTAGPFMGKFGQNFTEQDTFALVRNLTAYTLMFWGKSVDGSPVTVIEDGVPVAFISFPDPNTIDIGSFQYPLPVPANDGFWHHYAVTRDDEWFRVYQDGIQIGATLLSPGSTIACASLTLGAGNLYDPRSYSKALSAAAVEYYVSHPEQLP